MAAVPGGRRCRLAAFLKYYDIADDVSRYNLGDGISNWKDNAVEVIRLKRNGIIYIP